jgi:hypothetical protein
MPTHYTEVSKSYQCFEENVSVCGSTGLTGRIWESCPLRSFALAAAGSPTQPAFLWTIVGIRVGLTSDDPSLTIRLAPFDAVPSQSGQVDRLIPAMQDQLGQGQTATRCVHQAMT